MTLGGKSLRKQAYLKSFQHEWNQALMARWSLQRIEFTKNFEIIYFLAQALRFCLKTKCQKNSWSTRHL